MDLVYLITRLPRLERGAPAPIATAEFVRRCRETLQGRDRAELELLIQVESVEETARLTLQGQLADAPEAEIIRAIVSDRRDGVAPDQLPEWLRRPAPQHVLMRRHYFEVTTHARTSFLRSWANFRVDIGEVITAVLCRFEGMSRDAFLYQMQGSFDASAPLIIRNWDDPFLGLANRFPWIARVVGALGEDDLVAMSRTLDAVLWEKVESLASHELFSVETLLETYIKLRILQREASWDATAGKAVLDRILAESANSTAAATTSTGTR